MSHGFVFVSKVDWTARVPRTGIFCEEMRAWAIPHADVLRRLQQSDAFEVYRPERAFMIDQWDIRSKDGRFETQLGHHVFDGDPSCVDCTFLHKVVGSSREEARLFLVSLGAAVGGTVVTEWFDPVTDSDAWSVRYILALDE